MGNLVLTPCSVPSSLSAPVCQVGIRVDRVHHRLPLLELLLGPALWASVSTSVQGTVGGLSQVSPRCATQGPIVTPKPLLGPRHHR